MTVWEKILVTFTIEKRSNILNIKKEPLQINKKYNLIENVQGYEQVNHKSRNKNAQ